MTSYKRALRPAEISARFWNRPARRSSQPTLRVLPLRCSEQVLGFLLAVCAQCIGLCLLVPHQGFFLLHLLALELGFAQCLLQSSTPCFRPSLGFLCECILSRLWHRYSVENAHMHAAEARQRPLLAGGLHMGKQTGRRTLGFLVTPPARAWHTPALSVCAASLRRRQQTHEACVAVPPASIPHKAEQECAKT